MAKVITRTSARAETRGDWRIGGASLLIPLASRARLEKEQDMKVLVLAAMLAAALATPAYAISPSFEPPLELPVGGSPGAVAVGDFDGDRTMDVAGAYGPGAVSVWLGTGNPAAAFEHQTPDVAVGEAPSAMVARDLNGDGHDDLAVTNFGTPLDTTDDTVSILLGSPSGLVAGETVPVRDAPLGIDAGDLDGDGDVDLVVANFGTGSQHVSVLTGNGTGHFDAAHVDVGCQSAAVAIADLVDDARPDIGVACAASARILARDAGGNLAQFGPDHPGCDNGLVDVAAGNFDGLGKADLAVACLRPWFAVLGSASGFDPLPGPNPPQLRFPVFSAPGIPELIHVEAVDVNSDGFDDVLGADNSVGQATVADGGANGRFLPETAVAGEQKVGSAFSLPDLFDVTAADVNEDGKRDLIAGAGTEIVIRYATTPVPGLRTGSASSVAHNAATAGAIVNPSGNATTYRFEYGTTAAYGRTTAALPAGGTLTGNAYVPVSGVLDGLAPETEYHYRVVASNGNGTTYGRDRTLRTGATPPPAPQGGGQQQVVTPDTTAPTLALALAGTIKRATFLKRGVRATADPSEASTLEFELLGSTKRIRLARAGDVVLAERALPLAPGRRSVTLKLPRKFRAGLSRRFTLTIRVTATDAAGNRTVSTKRLKVRP
jgi:VCBS repeat protein